MLLAVLILGSMLFLYAAVGLLGLRVQVQARERPPRPPRVPRSAPPRAAPRAPESPAERGPVDPGDPYQPPDSLWVRHPRQRD